MNKEVTLLVFIEVQDGKAQDQIDAYNSLAPKVMAESGCISYALTRVADTRNSFVLVEKWRSEEALAAHEVAAHMIEADAKNYLFRENPATVMKLVHPLAG